MAIYLGYWLFLKVPERHDSQGRITLPWNITVLLSRVGPGVFFALFGAAIVAYSLHESVSYTRERSSEATHGKGRRAPRSPTESIWGGVGPGATAEPGEALKAARLRGQLEMEFLNSLPSLLRGDLKEEQKRSVSDRVTSLKLGLMELLWGSDLGDFVAFKDWTGGGASEPVPKRLRPPRTTILPARGVPSDNPPIPMGCSGPVGRLGCVFRGRRRKCLFAGKVDARKAALGKPHTRALFDSDRYLFCRRAKRVRASRYPDAINRWRELPYQRALWEDLLS